MALPGYGQTTIAVTSTADSGPGTLREAITTANGNTALTYLITLPANQTITLTSALPDITFSGTIAGGSTLCPATSVGGTTIARDPGAGEFRLLNLTGSNKTLVVADIIFLNGLVTTTGEQGAAIQVVVTANHNLIVQQCVFRNNRAQLVGALRMQGLGNLVIEDSYFDENTSVLSTGARTLFASNTGSTVRIDRTAFRQSTEGTGYIISFVNVATLRISNSTFAGGSITSGYVIRVANTQSIPVSLTLEHNTFGSVADSHVYANASNANISVQLRNNVFTTNGTTGFLAINSTGTATFTSLGGNVFANDITANLTLLASDRDNVGTAGLGLGSLTTVAGECIPVIPLGCFSQAIDAAVSSTLTTDALGTSQIGTARDAGAYESSNAASVTFTVASTSSVCGINSVTLTASGCTGGTVNWPGGSTGNIYLATTSGTYTATCTIGTCTTTASATVTIIPTSYTVTSLANSGPGSLRQAFADIGASSCTGQFTITFGVSGTVNLASALTAPAKDILLLGYSTTSTDVVLRGGGSSSNYRLLTVPSSATLTVRYLSFTNARVAGGQNGGAISQDGGNLYLDYCYLYGNTATNVGGGMYHGGGSFTITNTTFASNTATSNSGALHKGITDPGLIENCTFSGNVARAGGAIEAAVGSLTINNSTFTLNRAVGTSGTAQGGAIYGSGSTPVVINNCLIAGNTSIGTSPDLVSGFSSQVGYNIIGNTSGAGLGSITTGNIIDGSASRYLLAGLADYGGAVPTHALLPGSVAINAGSALVAPAQDQRGNNRVGTPDIGAFESQGFALTILSGNNQTTSPGTAFTNPLSVSVSSAGGEPVTGGVVSFVAPTSGASATLSSATATLSSSGTAAVNATANATAGGPYNVVASAAGTTPASVNFALSNVLPCVYSYTANLNNSGAGSLRQVLADIGAITGCPNQFTVTFATSGIVSLTSGLSVPANRDILIQGPSSTTTSVTLRGGGTSRDFSILSVPGSAKLTTQYLAFTNGRTSGNGGAISLIGGDLLVANCYFYNNTAGNTGGAVAQNSGSFTITNSTFASNTAISNSGALHKNTNEPCLIENCTFSGNVARAGGAIEAGVGSLTISNSTFTLNRAVGNPSPTGAEGGAIYGGNVPNFVTINNCLIAGNTSLGIGHDLVGVFVSGLGHNLIGNTTIELTIGGTTTGNLTNIAGSDYLLSALGNYGGATPTHALLPGSIAINAGSVSGAITQDQRGISRVSRPDIGAFESRGFRVNVSSGNNQTALLGAAFANPLRVMVAGNDASEPVIGGVVTFQAPVTLPSASLSGSNVTITSGLAQVTALASAGSGAYSVTALTRGGTISAQFSLTNVCRTIVYVTESGAGLQNGTSWTNAYPGTALQEAIGAASSCSGGQVWVARGTYRPTTGNEREATFRMDDNVAIYGGFVGDETALSNRPGVNPLMGQPSSSTLSGNIGSGRRSYHVIQNLPGLTNTAILDGFVVTRGSATDIGQLRDQGGAILNDGSSPTIRNCVFTDNQATYGGAMFNRGDGSTTSSPVIVNCLFEGNSATIRGGAVENSGQTGGSNASSFTRVLFRGNTATFGAAVSNAGAGGNCSPVFVNVSFQNQSGQFGAVMYNNASNGVCNPTFTNVSFQGNQATNAGDLFYNAATVGTSNLTLTNCVLFGNGSSNAFLNSNASITATYSLFDAAIDPATYTATNSLTTTISPFANTTSTELSSCAPAINAGNNAAPGLSGISTDIAGANRIFGTTVDMGAYEFTGSISAQTAFTTQPVTGSSVCTGAMVTASVSVSGTGPFSYQWYRDGTALTGITSATTASLTLSNVTSASAGSYSAVVTGSCNSVTSTAFSLTVNPPPAAGLLNNGPLTCAQTSVTLTASGGVSYTFANAGGTLGTPGASTTRTVSSPGTYSVTVSDSNGCISTTTTTVGSNTAVPSLTLTAGNACAGQPVTLTATGGLSSYTFTGPGGLISSGASRTASVSGISEGTYSFSVVATNAAGCSNTATATGAVISNIITVTSTADSGPGTLREAITTANSVTACGPFLITLPANQTIALTSALPDITFSGSIVGGSTLCPATGVGGSTIARDLGAGEFRLLLLMADDQSLLISNVTFADGKLGTAGPVSSLYQGGAGILIFGSYNLTIQRCLFRNNRVANIGGVAIYARSGNLIVEDSFFTDNVAGNGLLTTGLNVETVRIDRCVFRQVSTGSGAKILNLTGTPSGLVRNCTFYFAGTESSFGVNSAVIYAESSDTSVPTSVTVEQCSLNVPAQNLFYANSFYGNTNVFLKNNVSTTPGSTTALRTNTGAGTSTFTSLGGNVFASNITSNITLLASDRNNVGASGLRLGSLTTVAGACIPVIPLLPGSAAINAGVSSTLATDARGLARVGAPDAGAFESQGFALAISSGNNQSANVGTAFASPLRVSVSSSNGEPVDGGVVSFLTLSSGAGATLTNTTATIGSGMASVNATANATTGGPYAVTASANGTTPASVQFDLVNTMLNPAITGLAASPGTVTSGNSVTFTATVGNVSGAYSFTLTDGAATTTGTKTGAAFSQTWTADCAGVQDFTLTIAQSGNSATATAPLTVSPHPDYAAIVELFNSTNGPGWTNKAGWLQNCAPCTGNGGNPWYGLVCQGNRVVIVGLTNNGLAGTIPTSISGLTNLQRLSLDNNALTGNIPASLTALNLTLLYLNNNTLSGPIPTGIGSMTNLQRLYLNSNTLTGSIPTGIGSLTALQYLYLNNNALTGGIPASLGSLTALTQLYLNNNQLSGCYPASLTTLCSVSLKDFQGNAGLPGLGSAASLSAFCASGAGSDAFVASATASETAVCVGNAVSLSVNGGSTATFSWLAPAGVTLGMPATTSSISATATTSGVKTFTVTVSFGTSCSTTTTVSVSVNALPTASIAPLSATLTCAQPSLTLTATSSETALRWTTGATSSTLLVTSAGAYAVTATTPGGCTVASNIVVVESNTALSGFGITASGSVCAGNPVVFTASGCTGGTVNWPGGSIGNTYSTTVAGIYTATCTIGSCSTTASGTATIGANPTPMLTASGGGTLTCAQTSLTLTATSGLTNYSFSTGQSGSSNLLTVTSAGTYSVVATGANGCTALTSATVVSSSAVISASLVASGAISCNTPSVTLTASPSSLTYTFSGGATQLGSTNQATVSAAGTYSVTVSDAGGCTAVAQVTVTSNTTAPMGAMLTASGGGTLTCAQTALTLTASATGSLLSYSFVGAGVVAQSGNSATVNAAGAYSVVITGSNGCTTSAATTVYSNTTAPTVTLTTNQTITCASPTATLTATSGLTNYSFSTGQSGSSNLLTVTSAGTYSVIATGANGCTALTSATVVSSSAVISASLVASGAISCNTPSVTLTASPSSLTYAFSGGATQLGSTNRATVSAAGTYSVTVSDAGGCTAVAQVTVTSNTTAPMGAMLTASGGGTLTCAQTALTLTASATGSLLSYSFVGAGVVAQSGNSATVNAAGAYSVVITGSNGCTTSAATTVYRNTTPPSLSITPSLVTLTCASPSAVLSVVGTGDARWSTGEVSTAISVSVANTYSVTLTGAGGCTAVANAVVSALLPASATVTSGGALGCGVTTTTVRVQASGATSFTLLGPAGYSQTNSTGVFNVNVGGSYTGVAGQPGCVASNTVTVVEGGVQPVISSVQAGGALGNGACTVPVLAVGTGDRYVLTGPGYVFSAVFRTAAGRSVSFPDVVKPGTYTLTVYSGNCVVMRTVVVSGTACP